MRSSSPDAPPPAGRTRPSPDRGPRRRRVAAATVLVVALLAAGACSEGVDGSVAPPTTGAGRTSAPTVGPGPVALPGGEGVPRPDDAPAMGPELATPLQVALEAAWDEILATGVTPTGVLAAVWRPGQDRWTGTVGVADPRTGAPYTTGTHFRIGSVTKTVVITALLQLADQGLVDLDAPISAWFPTAPTGDPAELVVPDGGEITLRQLAAMTSGIANYTDDAETRVDPIVRADPSTSWSPVQLAKAGLDRPRDFPPGTDFHYSNTNTILLGLVIEQATGQPLPRVLDRMVLDPLGLDATQFVDTPYLPEPFARGFSGFTPDGSHVEATTWDPSWAWAAGQLVSTPDDMLTWAYQLGNGAFLEDATFEARRVLAPFDGAPPYGLGVMDLMGYWGHGGGINGYLTYVGYDPDLDIAVAVSLNWGDTGDGATILMGHLAPALAALAASDGD